MLRKDGGHVATQETADFVTALTEMGLKIKLLCMFFSFLNLFFLLNAKYIDSCRSFRGTY